MNLSGKTLSLLILILMFCSELQAGIPWCRRLFGGRSAQIHLQKILQKEAWQEQVSEMTGRLTKKTQKTQKTGELTEAELVELFQLLTKFAEGQARALEIAKNLLTHAPENSQYQEMYLGALFRNNRIDEIIDYSKQQLIQSPYDITWYIYQIKARNALDNPNLAYLGSKYRTDNRKHLLELLTFAITLDGANFFVYSNYLRVFHENNPPRVLRAEMPHLLGTAREAKELAETDAQQASIEFRLAKIYESLGDPTTALKHGEAALTVKEQSTSIRRFNKKMVRLIDKNKNRKNQTKEERPDWMADRDAVVFEDSYRNWYDLE